MSGEFRRLIDIMGTLRGEQGCPWDREQTHDSLKPYILEETYEVLEAIEKHNDGWLCEELGDVLLQVIFHSQIASENGKFNIEDVIRTLNEKLIRRHPHVFGNQIIKTSDEQKKHWEKLKRKEGKKSVLDGVPTELPSLSRASRIQQKAATVGFDWPKIDNVWHKVEEELNELHQAIGNNKMEQIEEELGDVLFSMVNIARFLHVDPESALRRTTEKFIHRFHQIEKSMEQEGKRIENATLEEMDEIWNRAKKKSKT